MKNNSRYKLPLLTLLVLAVVGVGVIKTSAFLAGDTIAPLTSAKVTGAKTKTSDGSWYFKDKAEVVLNATDEIKKVGRGSAAAEINKIDGEPDLSIVENINGGYELARTGMSFNGVSYMDEFSTGGTYSPAVLFSSSQSGSGLLPATLSLNELEANYSGGQPFSEPQDIYVYLVTTNIGSDTVHMTLYDTKDPQQFSQYGINVDAFAKAFSYSGNSFYHPALLPVPSEGRIVFDSISGQPDLLSALPPSSTVKSGVEKTYYRTGESGNFNVYSSPIKLSGAGEYTVYYYSVDKAGNIEGIKSIKVTIGPKKNPNKAAVKEAKKLLEELQKQEEKNRKLNQEIK
ncbi:MAG TPA: hypothetical protein P5096_04075 [Patescibacteria group bacterium]|nr:hypothetical protein [Patescibacteria group bacterium]